MVAECLDLNKPRSCKYGRKKKPKKKIDIYAVSVHDCTQEQNGSPYFSFPSFDNANGRLYQDPEILLPR